MAKKGGGCFADGVPYGAVPEAHGHCVPTAQGLMMRGLYVSRRMEDVTQIRGMVGGQKM